MRRAFSFSLTIFALAVTAYGSGCSGAKGGGSRGGGSSSTPHALGVIALGESHSPSGGSSTPTVLASFVSDAASIKTAACATQQGGCSFVSAPECGAGCTAGQVCNWDSACNPTCVAACTLSCATGQECYFASPNQPACRALQTFDAGAIAFAGTTTPITLFPPYVYQSSGSGAPFLAGAQLEIQASGAAAAGFDKFDDKFTATTFLQTNPPLDKIASTTIFGTGSIPIGWAPGNDSITITVEGSGGVATCTATDSTGAYQIPRAAVTAALGKGSSELVISVVRERDDWDKSESTHGSLTGETVQPVGWVEMTTTSSESASFQGCGVPGEAMCADGCFDLDADQYHCGSCTTVCDSSQSCVSGTCTTGATSTTACTTCSSSAASGTCSSYFDSCSGDVECTDYSTCRTDCASNTACISGCASSYPTGYSEYINYVDCVCFTACSSECTTSCAGQ